MRDVSRESSACLGIFGKSWVHRDPPEPVERTLVKLKVMSRRRFQELKRVLRDARMNKGPARSRQKGRSSREREGLSRRRCVMADSCRPARSGNVSVQVLGLTVLSETELGRLEKIYSKLLTQPPASEAPPARPCVRHGRYPRTVSSGAQ